MTKIQRVVIGDGQFYPIQPVLVTYTIGKLPLHLRSGTRNYRGKKAAELYEGERYLSKAHDTSQKQEIRRNALQ
jgi:hypothetical protein